MTGVAKKSVESALEKITAFIPSEVIGLYVSGVAIFSPQEAQTKWGIFFICLALIPAFMSLDYMLRKKRQAPIANRKTNAVLFIFAGAAFTAWAAALPDTPFLSFSSRASQIGGWAVILLAAFMYKVAELLDVAP